MIWRPFQVVIFDPGLPTPTAVAAVVSVTLVAITIALKERLAEHLLVGRVVATRSIPVVTRTLRVVVLSTLCVGGTDVYAIAITLLTGRLKTGLAIIPVIPVTVSAVTIVTPVAVISPRILRLSAGAGDC